MELVAEQYKLTEVGLIPSNWEVKELGTILTFGSGRDYKQLQNGEIPVYGTGGVMTYVNDFLYDGESVGIGRKGTIDKPVFLNGKFWTVDTLFYTHQFLNANPKFIYYKFCLIKWKEYNEASGVPSLNKNTLQKIKISIPEAAEQTAIATALSDADALIYSLEKLIAKKRNIKQGAMQKLLQPKEGWEVKKLGEVGTIVTGSTPPTQIKEYWNGSIPWITPTDILNNQKDIYHSEREITNTGLQVIRKLPANTLLVTCIASIGKNAILRNEGGCNQQINAVIPNSENSVDYLYFLIENSKSYLIGKAGITATMMISKKEFSEITYSFPDLKEQTRIATILSDMDTEISALETKLEKYKKVKLGMMQNLLTGKIRLI